MAAKSWQHQHKIQKKCLDTSNRASTAIITLSKQQPERITDQESQLLQHDSSLYRDEIRQQIPSGIPSPHVPDPYAVLNSVTWASLSLEGFWAIQCPLRPVNGIRPSNGWKVSLTL